MSDSVFQFLELRRSGCTDIEASLTRPRHRSLTNGLRVDLVLHCEVKNSLLPGLLIGLRALHAQRAGEILQLGDLQPGNQLMTLFDRLGLSQLACQTIKVGVSALHARGLQLSLARRGLERLLDFLLGAPRMGAHERFITEHCLRDSLLSSRLFRRQAWPGTRNAV